MRQPHSKVKKRSPLYVGATPFLVRVKPDQLAQIEAWRERQPDQPTVQEAIRRLTAKALACEAAQHAEA